MHNNFNNNFYNNNNNMGFNGFQNQQFNQGFQGGQNQFNDMNQRGSFGRRGSFGGGYGNQNSPYGRNQQFGFNGNNFQNMYGRGGGIGRGGNGQNYQNMYKNYNGGGSRENNQLFPPTNLGYHNRGRGGSHRVINDNRFGLNRQGSSSNRDIQPSPQYHKQGTPKKIIRIDSNDNNGTKPTPINYDKYKEKLNPKIPIKRKETDPFKQDFDKSLVHVDDWDKMKATEFFNDGKKPDSPKKQDKVEVNPYLNPSPTPAPNPYLKPNAWTKKKEAAKLPEFDNLNTDEINDVIMEKMFDEVLDNMDTKMFKSNMINIDNKKKKLDFGEKKHEHEDDKNLDKKGDERDWNNWVVPSFVPKKSVITPGLIKDNDYLAPGKNHYMKTSVSFIAHSQKYEQIRKKYESSGMKFTDDKFRPGFEALWGFGEKQTIPQDFFRQIEWKRPEQVFQGDYNVFQGSIDPNDVKQGILGDCYFLAAVSAIAENQNRIKKLFLTRERNNIGCYCVALCINGIWEDIVVDDFIPCKPKSNDIAFNHTVNNELWAILLEKAWAKAHGGYLNIDGGIIREALRDVSGAPCSSYFSSMESPEVHWKRILEGEQNNWVMCAASDDIRKTGNDARDKTTGLSGNHAYSLLAAYEIDNSKGYPRLVNHKEKGSSTNERIVKLRNPWAKGEWNGPWRDNDRTKWTPQMRQLLNHGEKDDGVFFMPFDKFLKYFHDYQICFYEDNYIYSAQRYQTSSKNPTVIEFDILQEGDYYFSINQVNRRFFRKKDSKLAKIILNRVRIYHNHYDGS